MKLLSANKVGCIDSINNEVDFGRLAFIYGLNGSGKSTIKDIFRKSFIEDGKLTPSFGVLPRLCNAEVKIFNRNVKFERGKIIQAIKSGVSIHVFDEEFVENYIYVNGIVSDSNKKEYFRMFVGDNINAKISAALNKTLESQISKTILLREISKIRTQYENVDRFLHLVEQIQQKLGIKYDLVYILNEIVMRRVLENVNKIDKTSVEWLKQGDRIGKKIDNCPYCGQGISDEIYSELISHYSEIILDSQLEEQRIIGEICLLRDQFLKLDFSDELSVYDHNELIEVQKICQSSIEKKVENISTIIELNPEHLTRLKQITRNLSTFIDQFEQRVNNLEVVNLFEIPEMTVSSDDIQNIKRRIQTVIIDNEIRKVLDDEITKIFKASKDVRSKMEKIETAHQTNLTAHLEKLNAKLKMYGFKYSVSFKKFEQKNLSKLNQAQLKLCLVPNMATSSFQDLEKDSIKSILSEGEKAILAWVFFITDLENKLKNGNHLVIVDDPISSYDSYRRFNLLQDITRVTKCPPSTEVLILSHEKGFSNVFSRLPKCKYFNIIDGKIIPINPNEIFEDDIKDDIDFIRRNSQLHFNEILIEFIIRSRNLIQYNKKFNDSIGGKYFRKAKFKENFSVASALIHFQANSLPIDYFNYVCNIYKKITSSTIHFDLSGVDLANLDLMILIRNPTMNMYIARMKVNKYLINCLVAHAIPLPHGEVTTGYLYTICKNFLNVYECNSIECYLPLLNVYNHPNDMYGLRRIDCSEISKTELFAFINALELNTQ